MRFPNDTVPTIVPAVDATEVSPKAAVSPVRRVGDGTRGTSAQIAGHPGVEEAQRAFYEREENDRRKMCRRIYHIPVMLDTRSGQERRKGSSQTDDSLTHIEREV